MLWRLIWRNLHSNKPSDFGEKDENVTFKQQWQRQRRRIKFKAEKPTWASGQGDLKVCWTYSYSIQIFTPYREWLEYKAFENAIIDNAN